MNFQWQLLIDKRRIIIKGINGDLFFKHKQVSLAIQIYQQMPPRLQYCLLFCLISMTLSSQVIDEKNFTLYTTKDGLSNDDINAIEQDSYGYMWIATRKGLNRFDGARFQQFYSDTSKSSLPQDAVRSLKWLDKEQLAAITLSGLHIINTKTLKERNLIIPADSLKSTHPLNSVFDATGDKKGNIFLITRTGFYQFNNKDELVFRYDHYSRKQVETGPVQFGWEIILADDNTVLLSAAKGLYIYNIEHRDLHLVNNSDNALYRQIVPTPRRFWFAHNDEKSFSVMYYDQKEFYFFDIAKKTKHLITDSVAIINNLRQESRFLKLNDSFFIVNTPTAGFYGITYNPIRGSYKIEPGPYFKDQLCPALFIDKKNHIWVGTTEGLLRQKRPTAANEKATISQTENSLDKAKQISSIAVFNEKVFVGFNLGDLYVFQRDSLKLIKKVDGIGQRILNNIVPFSPDTIIIGLPGILLNNKNFGMKLLNLPFSFQAIKIYNDRHNNIYANSGNSDTFYFRKVNEKDFTMHIFKDLSKIRFVTQMTVDPEGNLWFAGQGLMRLNKRSQKFDLFLDSFPAIKVGKKNITSNLVFDGNGNVYFGVGDNGLIIYHPGQKNFSHITRGDGLPDNIIRSILLHDQKLWLGTESGLASYDLQTKKISSFDISEGFSVDGLGIAVLYYDSVNHEMYAGGKNSFYRFDPAKFTKSNSPPDFFIESINVTGKDALYHPGTEIRLSHKHNNILVHLASINFEDAYQQQFAYRLVRKGDEEWENIGSQRTIIFNNLSAGTHRMQMKVYTRNNSWPEQIKEITIVILPPFWKTIWFYLVIGLIIASILYYLHRRRVDHITQKANVDKQLAQTEMKALHAQMNPHFIFNCLNSIREMILNNENEQASLYLSKFARLIRITLNQSAKQFVSLRDTIDYLDRYIEMEKIRNSHFTYTIDIADDLNPDEVMVPPMLIQPFIENAIWHGGSQKKNMDIQISFMKKENELVCNVEDNGIGIEESLKKKENIAAEPSVGIANIRQRIGLLNEKYNLRSTLSIQDKFNLPTANGSGTIVTLHLPIKTNESLWTST